MNWANWAGRAPQMQCTVSSHASLPTDVCTVVSDPTCQVSKSMVCDPIAVTDECLLTIRRAFEEPGTYCINITLGDDTSQALASALISVNGGESNKEQTWVVGEKLLPVVISLQGKRAQEYIRGLLLCLEASAETAPACLRVHAKIKL